MYGVPTSIDQIEFFQINVARHRTMNATNVSNKFTIDVDPYIVVSFE